MRARIEVRNRAPHRVVRSRYHFSEDGVCSAAMIVHENAAEAIECRRERRGFETGGVDCVTT